jgi:DNA-binding response OmpR family regulator
MAEIESTRAGLAQGQVMTREGAQPPPATILIVDDEPALRDALSYTLRKEGYRVESAASGPEAILAARQTRPDAVVLDVMLPGVDGLQVCRTLRAESTVPILLLSAKGEEIDRVVGLEMGADDYLGKPFAMRELLARIRAMLRRAEMMKGGERGGRGSIAAALEGTEPGQDRSAHTSPDDRVVLGELTIDRARRVATLAGKPLTLRPKEFDLLFFLAKHPSVVHSRNVLLHRVWGYDFPMGTRTVDVHVRWLRQKIERDPSRPTRLETVRGFGYRLVGEALASA